MTANILVYVDLGGSDGIPHVFVGLTPDGGAIEYYGYGPEHTAPVGRGKVFIGLTPPSGALT